MLLLDGVYTCRPAVFEKILALTSSGRICNQLITPCQDETAHVFSQPREFIAGLVALVPKPQANLTRIARISHETHRAT